MTVRDLIRTLKKFDENLPVVDYEGDEIAIVRMNEGDFDVAGDAYGGDPYVVIL